MTIRNILLLAMTVAATGGPASAQPLTLYASDFSSRLREFNSSTYNAVDRGGFSPPFFAGGLDVRGNGQLYGISSTLRIINKANAQNTQVGGNLPEQMSSLAFSPTDDLYAVSLGSTNLYRINPGTGAVIGGPVTITGTGGFGFFGIDFAPNGTLYGTASDSLYTINPATGAATPVATGIIPDGSPFTTGTIFGDIDIGADGLLRGFISPTSDSTIRVVDVNLANGAFLGSHIVNGMTTQSGLASIPEPSSLALLGAVAGLIGGRRRFRAPRPGNPS